MRRPDAIDTIKISSQHKVNYVLSGISVGSRTEIQGPALHSNHYSNHRLIF